MKLFLLDSRHLYGEILYLECRVVTCKKTVWAELPNGKRFLMGATAFCTFVSALRVQKAKLQQALRARNVKFEQPELYQKWQERYNHIVKYQLH